MTRVLSGPWLGLADGPQCRPCCLGGVGEAQVIREEHKDRFIASKGVCFKVRTQVVMRA